VLGVSDLSFRFAHVPGGEANSSEGPFFLIPPCGRIPVFSPSRRPLPDVNWVVATLVSPPVLFGFAPYYRVLYSSCRFDHESQLPQQCLNLLFVWFRFAQRAAFGQARQPEPLDFEEIEESAIDGHTSVFLPETRKKITS
jgi:hypothetical protein